MVNREWLSLPGSELVWEEEVARGVVHLGMGEDPMDHRSIEQWMLPGVSLLTQATLPAYSDCR